MRWQNRTQGITGIPEAEPEEENDTSFEHNDGADDDTDEDKKATGDNAAQGSCPSDSTGVSTVSC